VAQNRVIKAMLKSRLVAMYAGSRADHGLEFLAILSIRMKEMVGTLGLKPQTSTVSIFEVIHLKPFACLAFPHTTYLKTPRKQHIFGDEF
jgi:hypothetical protein